MKNLQFYQFYSSRTRFFRFIFRLLHLFMGSIAHFLSCRRGKTPEQHFRREQYPIECVTKIRPTQRNHGRFIGLLCPSTDPYFLGYRWARQIVRRYLIAQCAHSRYISHKHTDRSHFPRASKLFPIYLQFVWYYDEAVNRATVSGVRMQRMKDSATTHSCMMFRIGRRFYCDRYRCVLYE